MTDSDSPAPWADFLKELGIETPPTMPPKRVVVEVVQRVTETEYYEPDLTDTDWGEVNRELGLTPSLPSTSKPGEQAPAYEASESPVVNALGLTTPVQELVARAAHEKDILPPAGHEEAEAEDTSRRRESRRGSESSEGRRGDRPERKDRERKDRRDRGPRGKDRSDEAAEQEVCEEPVTSETISEEASEPHAIDWDTPDAEDHPGTAAEVHAIEEDDFSEESEGALTESVGDDEETAEKEGEGGRKRSRRKRRRRKGRKPAPESAQEESAADESGDASADEDRLIVAEAASGVDTEWDEAADALSTTPGDDIPGADSQGESETAEESPARPKRRRRRRSKRSRREDPTTEQAETSETAEEASPGEEEAASEEAAPKRPSRSRRRRRDRQEKKPVEAKLEEDVDIDDEELDDDEDDDSSGKRAHRNIPSWEDAVGMIISTNVESRSKRPQNPNRGRHRGKPRRS